MSLHPDSYWVTDCCWNCIWECQTNNSQWVWWTSVLVQMQHSHWLQHSGRGRWGSLSLSLFDLVYSVEVPSLANLVVSWPSLYLKLHSFCLHTVECGVKCGLHPGLAGAWILIGRISFLKCIIYEFHSLSSILSDLIINSFTQSYFLWHTIHDTLL